MNGTDEYPGVRATHDERNELMRRHAVKLLADQPWMQKAIPEARAWAEHWARVKPLGRPLGTGEPVTDVARAGAHFDGAAA